MDEIALPDAVEPNEWFVVFHPKGMSRWLAMLACGHFKHVSAFAYCPGFKAWLVYDAQWSGLRLMLFAHGPGAKTAIARHIDGCTVLKFTRTGTPMALSSRLGFTCVSAVKHLLGVRCGFWRPDALYAHLLRNGAIPLDERHAASPG